MQSIMFKKKKVSILNIINLINFIILLRRYYIIYSDSTMKSQQLHILP